MKRGRPTIRFEVQRLIDSILKNSKVPLSINAICEQIHKETGRRISWNTVHKYLMELVEIGKVEVFQLPHSKDPSKAGMKVYALKK